MLTSGLTYVFTYMSTSVCLQERLSEAQLNFLFDELDTVQAYERRGQNKDQNQGGHDPLMLALDNLNRVQQLEIIHGTEPGLEPGPEQSRFLTLTLISQFQKVKNQSFLCFLR